MHDASPWSGGSTKFPVATVGCRSGTMTRPACAFGSRSLWSILLTHRKFRGRRRRTTGPPGRDGMPERTTNCGKHRRLINTDHPCGADACWPDRAGSRPRLPVLPAQQNRMAPAHRRPLGPFSGADIRRGFQKISARKGAGVSRAEKVGRLVSAPMGTPMQSSDVAAPCLINKRQLHETDFRIAGSARSQPSARRVRFKAGSVPGTGRYSGPNNASFGMSPAGQRSPSLPAPDAAAQRTSILCTSCLTIRHLRAAADLKSADLLDDAGVDDCFRGFAGRQTRPAPRDATNPASLP
jgi:hypothetical protein